jgi:hypothetical protein
MTAEEFWFFVFGWTLCWVSGRFAAVHRGRVARRRFRELLVARHRRERDEHAGP